ncbi:MAG: hypothetical protein OEZ39_12955 [Gammaproteobacteria bacterium]|nr:hypothetical protein [Gammaproteobacteria bacterium]MDH5652757.1 hypothetical protein [Gammaproteobacteria bacterium]
MDFRYTHILIKLIFLPAVLLSSGLYTPLLNAEESLLKQIETAEQRFRTISTEVYAELVRQKKFGDRKFTDVSALEQEVLTLMAKDNHIQAIYLIRKHLKLIKDNIDNRAVFYLVDMLLRHNEWNTAREILDTVSSEGDKSLRSNVTFIFAKYYADRQQWQETLNNLEGVLNDLPTEDAHYTLLLQGIAEQSRKNHRKAVAYYQKIPDNSKYYPLAVINTAVAYIRQGWWTDAKLEIDKVLNSPKIAVNDEIINRMNLINGYSLLQQGYFRNSRDSFRDVGLDSRYTNRALLGIALTATNQEDFIGALNAINILKQKQSFDLSVDESHLMLPYVYEKLKQNLTAATGYKEAVGYYKKRIDDVTDIMTRHVKNNLNISISGDRRTLIIGNTQVEFTRHYPKSFLQNHAELKELSNHLDDVNPNTRKKFEHILAEHTILLKKLTLTLLNERIEFLSSYMSQSRFGLARLYDSSAGK